MDTITHDDLQLIISAKNQLENSNFLIKTLNLLGKPIEQGINQLPIKQKEKLNNIVQNVLLKVVEANLKTMDSNIKRSYKILHKSIVTISGVVGGFFGAAGFSSDLFVSTNIMMRSIIDIARDKGLDINDTEVKLACLEVLALGGNSTNNNSSELGYYSTRISLRNITNEIIKQGANNIGSTLMKNTSNPLFLFISKIASRYSVQVSEKFLLEAIPVIGAIGGGSINYIFLEHYQKIAEAHFTLKSLEKKYSLELIKEKYNSILLN